MSKRMIVAITAATIFWAFSFFVYLFKIGGETLFTAIADLIPVMAAVFALVATIVALSNFRRTEKHWLIWMLMSIGLSLYALGEISWAVYEVLLGIEVPYPSWADLFWLTGFVPLFAALGLKLARLEARIELREKLLISFALLFVLVLSLRYVLIPIATYVDISILEKFLDLAYPIQDLFLVAAAAVLVLVYGRGMLGRPWLLIGLGFIAFGAADLLYSYLSWNELYNSGNLIDILWVTGYLLIGLGAVSKLDIISTLMKIEGKEERPVPVEKAVPESNEVFEHHLV